MASSSLLPLGVRRSVVVFVAMEAEATPFVEHLGLSNITKNFFPRQTPFHSFQGTYNNDYTVTVVTNGKDRIYDTGVDNCGTVPAAVASFLTLQKIGEENVDLVINAGTCGGFKRKGAEIGSVYLTTAVAHHDRRIPIPSFDEYGIGRLESKLTVEKMAANFGFKTGVCTTGNSLDKTDEDDKHMLANDASVKDMEAAAIAWSCEMHDKPFLGVKVVTDIVDGDRPTQDQFLENLHAASRSLQEALPKILDYICGKEHQDIVKKSKVASK